MASTKTIIASGLTLATCYLLYQVPLIYYLCAALIFEVCFVANKSFQFYVLSYFYDYLWEHQKLAKKIGIKFVDDRTWVTCRKDTQVYIDGLFIKMFSWFVGINPILTDKTRKSLIRLQSKHVNEIDMEKYFDTIDGKSMNLVDFETFLSKSVLIETNRIFKILDAKTEEVFLKHLLVLRSVVSAITGDPKEGIKMMIANRGPIMKLSAIIKSVPDHKKALLYVPQLAVINNFSKLLVKREGEMTGFEPYEFLEPASKYSVFIESDHLVFIDRHQDENNTPSNKAFGPTGVQCPGNKFTFKFIQSIISFLQSFKVDIKGKAIIKGARFTHITNKDDIVLTFKKYDNPDKLVIDDEIYNIPDEE